MVCVGLHSAETQRGFAARDLDRWLHTFRGVRARPARIQFAEIRIQVVDDPRLAEGIYRPDLEDTILRSVAE
jgi:hypothetical protein